MSNEKETNDSAPADGTDAAVVAEAAGAAAEVTEQSTPASRPVKARDLADLEKLKYRAREERRQARASTEAAEARARAAEEARAATDKRLQELEAQFARIKAGEALLMTQEQGGDPQLAVENYVQKSAPEQQIEAIKRQLEADRAERQREREARSRDDQQRQAQALLAAERTAVIGFAQTVLAEPKKWPHLTSEFEPEEIAQKAHEIQQWAKQQEWSDESGRHVGVAYGYDEVASYLERQAKLVHDRRQARRGTIETPATPETGSAPGEAKASEAGGQTKRSGTATRTVKRSLSRDEEAAIDLANLRAAMARDAAARNGNAKH